MSIHEHLPPQVRKGLKGVGWTKGLELAKVARRDGQDFDCATWLHRAREMPKEDFRRAVEKELTGREEEPSELIYFKVYKNQIPVIEQAIETAALMLGESVLAAMGSGVASRAERGDQVLRVCSVSTKNLHNLHFLHNFCCFYHLQFVTVTAGRYSRTVWKHVVGIAQFVGPSLRGLVKHESPAGIA